MTRSPEPTTRQPYTAVDWVGLAGVFILGLMLRQWLASMSSGLTMDSPLYVRMAEAIRATHPISAPAHHGYPLLVAFALFFVPGREASGIVVSHLASLALVPLLWWSTREQFGRLQALTAAALVALHPLLAIYGVAIMTEATFLLFAVAGVALLERGKAIPGGALLGAAWWVRPEAVVVAPLAILLAPLRGRQRVVAILIALVVALPHSLVLASADGRFSLSPKTSLVHAPFADSRSAEWRLGDGAGFADTVGVATRLVRDGSAMVRAYPARLAQHLLRVVEAWPVPLLLMTLLGVIVRTRSVWLAFLALPFLYPLLASPADVRFAQLVVPALAIFSVSGIRHLLLRSTTGQWLAAAMLVTGSIWLWVAGPARTRALAFDDGPMASLRGAGTWLASHSSESAVVMDRKSYVPFFANRRHVQLPDEPLDELLEYARNSDATHIVVEEYVVASLRPQLAPLLDASAIRQESRVRLVFSLRPAPGEGVAVFEVVRPD